MDQFLALRARCNIHPQHYDSKHKSSVRSSSSNTSGAARAHEIVAVSHLAARGGGLGLEVLLQHLENRQDRLRARHSNARRTRDEDEQHISERATQKQSTSYARARGTKANTRRE